MSLRKYNSFRGLPAIGLVRLELSQQFHSIFQTLKNIRKNRRTLICRGRRRRRCCCRRRRFIQDSA